MRRLSKPSTCLQIFPPKRRIQHLETIPLVSLSNRQLSVKGVTVIGVNSKSENVPISSFLSRNHSEN